MNLVDKLEGNVFTDLKTETYVLYQEPYKSESLKNHTFFFPVFFLYKIARLSYRINIAFQMSNTLLNYNFPLHFMKDKKNRTLNKSKYDISLFSNKFHKSNFKNLGSLFLFFELPHVKVGSKVYRQ